LGSSWAFGGKSEVVWCLDSHHEGTAHCFAATAFDTVQLLFVSVGNLWVGNDTGRVAPMVFFLGCTDDKAECRGCELSGM